MLRIVVIYILFCLWLQTYSFFLNFNAIEIKKWQSVGRFLVVSCQIATFWVPVSAFVPEIWALLPTEPG